MIKAVESFNNIQEFITSIENRGLNPVFNNAYNTIYKHLNSKEKFYDKNFYFLNDYQESKNFLLYGYSKEVKNLKTSINYQIPTSRNKKFLSPVGSLPVVANAIKNIPCSMLYTKKSKIEKRAITFYYSPTSTVTTSSENLLKAGKEFLNLVNHFEKYGIKTKIYMFVKF